MLPGDSLTGSCGGAFPPSCLEWGGSLGVALEVASDGDEGPTQSGKWCCHLDQRARVWWLLGQWREESAGQTPIQEGIPLGNAQQGRCRSIP